MRSTPVLLFLTLASPVAGKFAVHKAGKPLSREESWKGKTGFQCLKELFGEEGEHILSGSQPTNKYSFEEEEILTEAERHEAIFRIFGDDGIESICGITGKLRRARLLRPAKAKRSEQSAKAERRTQACVPAQPLYPSENDVDNAYNDWAEINVDSFLPDGADRTSRTDPDKLITDIQDSIDAALEAEYSSMSCYPIMNGIAALASIPDIVIFQQGSIVHGIKNIVCGFGKRVSTYTTDALYRQLSRAQSHDYYIDGAESRATYTNTAAMVGEVCESNGRLGQVEDDLKSIKRTLENRRT